MSEAAGDETAAVTGLRVTAEAEVIRGGQVIPPGTGPAAGGETEVAR